VILNICFSVSEQISDVPGAPGYMPRLFPVVSTNSTKGKNLYVRYNVFLELVSNNPMENSYLDWTSFPERLSPPTLWCLSKNWAVQINILPQNL